MRKYQVWVRGSILHDVEAKNKTCALKEVRETHGFKRLPSGTAINEIPPGYYEDIVEMDRKAGFNASNL